jgi:hypothetical protein
MRNFLLISGAAIALGTSPVMAQPGPGGHGGGPAVEWAQVRR